MQRRIWHAQAILQLHCTNMDYHMAICKLILVLSMDPMKGHQIMFIKRNQLILWSVRYTSLVIQGYFRFLLLLHK